MREKGLSGTSRVKLNVSITRPVCPRHEVVEASGKNDMYFFLSRKTKTLLLDAVRLTERIIWEKQQDADGQG